MKNRAGWKRALDLLKEQTGLGTAFGNGFPSGIRYSLVLATRNDENLPEEKHVQSVLSIGMGSRLKVGYCATALLKRLGSTKNWTVALKCLIVIHRALLEGGFMFQDQLAALTNCDREYFHLFRLSDDSASWDVDLTVWVRRYARYLDERLICSRAVRNFFDLKSPVTTCDKVCYMANEELLHEIKCLQRLLQELYEFAAEGNAVDCVLALIAWRLMVSDAFRLHGELAVRVKEMLERVTVLEPSEAMELLHFCKNAPNDLERLVMFIRRWHETSVPHVDASGVVLKPWISDADLLRLQNFVRSVSKQPSVDYTSLKSSFCTSQSFRLVPTKSGRDLRRTLSSSFDRDKRNPSFAGSRYSVDLASKGGGFSDENMQPLPSPLGHDNAFTQKLSSSPQACHATKAPTDFLSTISWSPPRDTLDLIDLSDKPVARPIVVSDHQIVSEVSRDSRLKVASPNSPLPPLLSMITSDWERTLVESMKYTGDGYKESWGRGTVLH